MKPNKLPASALCLLFLGLLLRLWATGHARFTGDESHQFAVAEAITKLRAFPAYGLEVTSSAARHPGPLAYFLVAPAQLLGDSPRLGALFVALLHILSGLLFVRATHKLGGANSAIAAALLFAFAPWDILYGDRIWGSSLSPVLGALAIYGCVDRRPAWQAVSLASALCLPQLHLSAPVVWAVLLAWLALRPRSDNVPPWSARALLAGALVTIVLYSPAIVAELRSDFSNSRAILTHAGGQASPAARALVPLQTFGYAVLYGSAEIGYHFARGYWGGGFSELDTYFSAKGASELLLSRGAVLLAATLGSVLVAIAGWVVTISSALRRPDEATARLTIALTTGVAVAALLMFGAKKGFFPHYANVLVPWLLLPVASGLAKLGRAGLALAAFSAATMGASTVRYYLDVDRLNGVIVSEWLVETLAKETRPVSLSFTHFDNRYALDRLAEVQTGRPLPLAASSKVRYTVHNTRPHEGPIPEGGTVVDGVLVERLELSRPKPKGLVNRASDSVEDVVVSVDGGTPLRARGPTIQYGDQPWQHLGREVMVFDGHEHDLLFFHPIAERRVTAAIRVPERAMRATLMVGLSDAAVASSANGVEVRFSAGASTHQVIVGGKKGLSELSANLPAGTATVSVQIFAENDGARVLGFEVEFFE